MVKIIINDDSIEDINLFVFDKDGTIIDLYNYWCNMIDLRAGELCSFYKIDSSVHKDKLMLKMGVDVSKRILLPEGPVGLLPRAVVQKAAADYLGNIGLRDVNKVCFKVFKTVDEISLSRFDTFIRPINGMLDLFDSLKQKNCKIAIATTDKTERAELAIEFLNMKHLVDSIIGADKVKKSKPAPDMLESITVDLNINPNNSVMVGDAKTDIQMGINARFKASIGVYSGLTSRSELKKLTPYVIKDISAIKIE